MPGRDEARGDPPADEARGADDEDSHGAASYRPAPRSARRGRRLLQVRPLPCA
jgi:hypothetical protein